MYDAPRLGGMKEPAPTRGINPPAERRSGGLLCLKDNEYQKGLHCAVLSSLVVLAAPHRALLKPLAAENTAYVWANVEKYLTRINNPGRREPLRKGQAEWN